MRKLIIILSALLPFIAAAAAYLYFSKPAPDPIPPGMVLVRQAWIDSLEMIATRPPEVVTDTIYKKYVEKAPPVAQDIKTPTKTGEDTSDYLDTLKTPYFDVFLYDRFKAGHLVYRSFSYDLFAPIEVTRTITQIQKVPFPYSTPPPQVKKIHLGIMAGTFISADLNYHHNGKFYGAGLMYAGGKKHYYFRYQVPIF